MKKLILIFTVLLIYTGITYSQPAKQKAPVKKQLTAKKTLKNKKAIAAKKQQTPNTGTTQTLISTRSYTALRAENNTLRISDPTILTLNSRARGLETGTATPGVLGMPKRMYGFSNGRIFFRPTDAASTGTSTGSGSVGTGTWLGSAGTAGSSFGLNGKSPEAGPGIYGVPGGTNFNKGRQNPSDLQKRGTDKKQ
ncbi:MAG TPA: hypothetical protein VM368_04670 [Flavisolibacter sp.]|nr:hypothetical protein [Flavisolibacter sp.]